MLEGPRNEQKLKRSAHLPANTTTTINQFHKPTHPRTIYTQSPPPIHNHKTLDHRHTERVNSISVVINLHTNHIQIIP